MGVNQKGKTLIILGCVQLQKTDHLMESTQESAPDDFAGPLQERFVKENVKALTRKNDPPARSVIFLKPFWQKKAP